MALALAPGRSFSTNHAISKSPPPPIGILTFSVVCDIYCRLNWTGPDGDPKQQTKTICCSFIDHAVRN